MSDLDKPIPIRLPASLLAKIEQAADKLQLSKQDVMREAMKLGLAHYARIEWDVQGAVLDKSAALAPPKIIPVTFRPPRENLVAEDTTDNAPLPQIPTDYKPIIKRAKQRSNKA